MSDCLFCKIVSGQIPSLKVYEDADVFAFLDIAPVNAGHTLVVPKAHHVSLEEMPVEDAARLFAAVRRLAPGIRAAVGAPAFNIGVNTGKEAGQIVMHAHVHVMPRFADDGLTHWPKKHFTEEEMRGFAGKIAQELGAAG
ncbi:MAG: hypothetical protein RLZZ324_576 [Candidatus Parcubacteria bacterium]|jgi:histidine triad (HIT) family protein